MLTSAAASRLSPAARSLDNCSTFRYKFWLDSLFQSSLMFQQMLKQPESEKHVEIRGSSEAGGSTTAGASDCGNGLAGKRRLQNRQSDRGLGLALHARRPGTHDRG